MTMAHHGVDRIRRQPRVRTVHEKEFEAPTGSLQWGSNLLSGTSSLSAEMLRLDFFSDIKKESQGNAMTKKKKNKTTGQVNIRSHVGILYRYENGYN